MARERKPLSEREWFAADRWQDLLIALFPDGRFTKSAGAQRKLRLLLCAAARQGWDVMPDDRCREAVEVAERFAEGNATAKQLAAARTAAGKALDRAERAREIRERRSGAEFQRRLKAAGPEQDWSGKWPPDLAVPVAGRMRAEFAARMAVLAAADAVNVPVLEKGLLFVPDVVTPLEEFAARLPKWYEVGDADPPDPRPDLIRDVFGYPFAPVTVEPNWRTGAVTALADGIAADGAFGRVPVLADALEKDGCSDLRLLAHCREEGPHVRGCWAVDAVRGTHWQPGARTRGR